MTTKLSMKYLRLSSIASANTLLSESESQLEEPGQKLAACRNRADDCERRVGLLSAEIHMLRSQLAEKRQAYALIRPGKRSVVANNSSISSMIPNQPAQTTQAFDNGSLGVDKAE
ncbi:unnamed protein product [Protopolystoma xenopodis]|uniref:Uncharacterized protein n=1 Tax=Protopolystoma xenopodis TaxID=117903 RepID=A0A448X3N1_9PLAT|nr:unnamed protein product [Protopolystoma xenopodis]